MKVVSTFHPATSVVDSVKCNFEPDAEHLVVARPGQIEVHKVTPDGLALESVTEIWGRILRLRPIATKHDTHNLLVLTDHPEPRLFVLAHVKDASQLKALKVIELYDRTARNAEFLNDVFVHPSGNVALASCYAGKLSVITFRKGQYRDEFSVSLLEHNLLSLCFLPSLASDVEHVYPVALLHLDYQQRLQLISRDLHVSDYELSPALSTALPATPLRSELFVPDFDPAPILVPVPPAETHDVDEDVDMADDSVEDSQKRKWRGGVLVLGGSKILLFEMSSEQHRRKQREKAGRSNKKLSKAEEKDKQTSKGRSRKNNPGPNVEGAETDRRKKDSEAENKKVKSKATLDWPFAEVGAYCSVNAQCSRLFLADTWGRLAILVLDTLRIPAEMLTLIPLGETSPATSLAYLSNQIIYLGSHLGDSQLLRIHRATFSSAKVATGPPNYIPTAGRSATIADLTGALVIPPDIPTVPASTLLQLESKAEGSSSPAKRKRDAPTWDIDMDEDKRAGRKGRVIASEGNFIEVLENFQNLAPILDAVFVEAEGTGQRQIVTCSGGRNSGALKVVRKGVEFKESAQMEGVGAVSQIWAIRRTYQDPLDAYIIASTLHETHLLRIESDDTMAHVPSDGSVLSRSQPTLAAGNMFQPQRTERADHASHADSNFLAQVTPDKVILLVVNAWGDDFEQAAAWTPEEGSAQSGTSNHQSSEGRKIVAADINASQIVLALTDGRLVLITISAQSDQPVTLHAMHRDFYGEISAVSCAPMDPDSSSSSFVAVGFWEDNRVRVLKSEKLLDACTPHSVVLPSLPRSLRFHNFGLAKTKGDDYVPHLLAALADGSLAAVPFETGEDGTRRISKHKLFKLGATPTTLVPCDSDGKKVVLCCGTRSAVVFLDGMQLGMAPALLRNVVTATRLHTESFDNAVALVTPTGISIGHFRQLNKIHIRSYHFGLDNPRKIAFSEGLDAYGVGCAHAQPSRVSDGDDIPIGSLKVLDSKSFSVIGELGFGSEEEVTAVEAVQISEEGKPVPYFALGTVQSETFTDMESDSGRLILANVNGDSTAVREVASVKVPGCIYAISNIGKYIAIAVNSAVELYSLETSPNPASTARKLSRKYEWNHNYFVSSLVVRGDYIFIGDAISSVSVLRLGPNGLKTIARDYGPVWPRTIQTTANDGIIGADNDCNLFSFRLSGTSLERDGNYYLGDVVNKFIPGAPTANEPEANVKMTASQTFFTSTGRIGFIADVLDMPLSLELTALDRNLTAAMPGVGQSHAQWRAPANSRGRTDADPSSQGFIDGEFLDSFLSLDDQQAAAVLSGKTEAEKLSMSFAEIEATLQDLHALI